MCGGTLEKNAGSGPHGKAAIADLLSSKIFLRRSCLSEIEGIESEISGGSVTRLAALGNCDAGED